MSTLFVGCHFHDPDNPEKVLLVELNGPSFAEGTLGATLHAKLQGESELTGPFAPAARRGNGTKASSAAAHLYLYDLAQSESDLHTTVRSQLEALMAQGEVAFDDGKLASLNGQNVGWLIVEMAQDKASLSADPWSL